MSKQNFSKVIPAFILGFQDVVLDKDGEKNEYSFPVFADIFGEEGGPEWTKKFKGALKELGGKETETFYEAFKVAVKEQFGPKAFADPKGDFFMNVHLATAKLRETEEELLAVDQVENDTLYYLTTAFTNVLGAEAGASWEDRLNMLTVEDDVQDAPNPEQETEVVADAEDVVAAEQELAEEQSEESVVLPAPIEAVHSMNLTQLRQQLQNLAVANKSAIETNRQIVAAHAALSKALEANSTTIEAQQGQMEGFMILLDQMAPALPQGEVIQ